MAKPAKPFSEGSWTKRGDLTEANVVNPALLHMAATWEIAMQHLCNFRIGIVSGKEKAAENHSRMPDDLELGYI